MVTLIYAISYNLTKYQKTRAISPISMLFYNSLRNFVLRVFSSWHASLHDNHKDRWQSPESIVHRHYSLDPTHSQIRMARHETVLFTHETTR